MQKILFTLLAICLLSACKKNDPDFLFTIPLQDNDFAIPPTASSFQVHYFNIDNVPTNGAELFSTNNISTSDANAILPQTGRMTVLVGNADYDFIEQMSVRICDAGDFSENCGIEIFWRQPVPIGVGSILDLVPSDQDIKQYLLQDKVNIQVKLEQLRNNPPEFVETRLSLDFSVR